MGAENSKNRSRREQNDFDDRNQFTEVQVGHLLEEQKIFYERKMENLAHNLHNQHVTRQHMAAVPSSSYAQATPQTPQSPYMQAAPVYLSYPRQPPAPTPAPPRPAPAAVPSPAPPSPVRPTPQPSAPPLVQTAVISPTPYSYVHNQLQQEMNRRPNTPPASQSSGARIYPTANSPRTQISQPSTSSFVFVNKEAEVKSTDPKSRDRSASRSRGRRYGKNKGNTLESYVAERRETDKVPCPNAENGCKFYLKLADLESHIKECLFRIMLCPINFMSRCDWQGLITNVVNHFDAEHPIHRQANVDTEMSIDKMLLKTQQIQPVIRMAHLVVLGKFKFIFTVSVDKQNLYIVVMMLGTAQCASKWTYKIDIYNKAEPRRKFQHIDNCYPINTNLKDLMKEGKCAMVPLNYAETFVNENKLTGKFYITQENTERRADYRN